MGKVIRIDVDGNNQNSSYVGTFANYTALTTAFPTANFGDFAVVENDEGTKWLPWSLGGTYYPQGTYYYDGSEWASNVVDIAEELENITTEIGNLTFQSIKVVKNIGELIDIHTPNGSDEIELGNFVYLIDSVSFDVGIYKLISNVDTAIIGLSQGINELMTTEDNTSLIESTSNLFLFQIKLKAEGTGSQAIKMAGTTGFETLDMKYVEIVGDTKYGTLSGIRQAYWSDGFSFEAKEGFTLEGTWLGGFSIFNSRIIDTGNFILGAGAGLTLNNIRSNVNCDVASGDVAFSFDYANINDDDGYQLDGGVYNGLGQMAADFTTGDETLAHKSRRSRFRNNTGEMAVNTVVRSGWKCTSEVVTPLTLNVPAKVLGTTFYKNSEHITTVNNNEFVYNSTVPAYFDTNGSVTFDGGPNDEIRLEIRRWNNLTSDYTVLESYTKTISNVLGGNDVVTFILLSNRNLFQYLDRLEIWVVNTSDDTDVTMLSDSIFYMVEND